MARGGGKYLLECLNNGILDIQDEMLSKTLYFAILFFMELLNHYTKRKRNSKSNLIWANICLCL